MDSAGSTVVARVLLTAVGISIIVVSSSASRSSRSNFSVLTAARGVVSVSPFTMRAKSSNPSATGSVLDAFEPAGLRRSVLALASCSPSALSSAIRYLDSALREVVSDATRLVLASLAKSRTASSFSRSH